MIKRNLRLLDNLHVNPSRTGPHRNAPVKSFFNHEKICLIFLFEPRNRKDKVPFDLTTFKYVAISEAAEIPNKVKSEIIAILRDAGAPL